MAETASEFRRVCVVGNGGWGTALALVAQRDGAETSMWGLDADYVQETIALRENPRYLPGVELPRELRLGSDVRELAADADLLVCAVPTQFVRETMTRLAPDLPAGVPVISASKGLENGTLARVTEILRDTLGPRPLGALSGPSHAEEVARGRPTSVVVAGEDAELRRGVQRLFSDSAFRVYGSPDLVGVELAGAIKNVIAIGAGVCDGLELGDNAKSALVTRGAAEIARLGRALGADPVTFHGLAGIGDLIATCFSPHGRNRSVGERLGRGETLQDVLGSMVQVAEGVRTTESVVEVAHAHGVEMPISEQVHALLFGGQRPHQAVLELMTRALRPEREVE